MKDKRTWLFLGGVVVGAAAVTIIGSQAARNLAVAGVAQGMKLRDDAMAAVSGIREDAQDVYAEKIRNETGDADECSQEIEVTQVKV